MLLNYKSKKYSFESLLKGRKTSPLNKQVKKLLKRNNTMANVGLSFNARNPKSNLGNFNASKFCTFGKSPSTNLSQHLTVSRNHSVAQPHKSKSSSVLRNYEKATASTFGRS